MDTSTTHTHSGASRSGATRIVALAAALLTALLLLAAPSQASALELQAGQTSAGSLAPAATFYKLGKTVSGSVGAGKSQSYTFSLVKAADVNIYVKVGSEASWTLKRNGSSSSILSLEDEEYTDKTYLSAGSYTITVSGDSYYYYYGSADRSYRFSLSAAKQTLQLSSKKGNFKKIGDSREIPFVYSGTDTFVSGNLSLKVKNTKVASASYSVGYGGIGTLTITAKRLGTTKVTLSLPGAQSVKYTVNVTKSTAFVAVGARTKLSKPIGVKKVKYESKSKSKVRVGKKNGVVVGKSGGKAKVVGVGIKGKKKVKFTYTVIVTDYMKLARKAYDYIEDYVPNSDKLKINYAYRGYSKTLIDGVKKLPVVYLDYSYGNSYGTWNRGRLVAYYDASYDDQYRFVSDADDIKKKKSMNKKAIKK